MASWREDDRMQRLQGRAPWKMDAEAARQKAKAMKAEALSYCKAKKDRSCPVWG